MLMNITNTPKYNFIEEETIRISKELGFVQEDTLQLTLSSVMGQVTNTNLFLFLERRVNE